MQKKRGDVKMEWLSPLVIIFGSLAVLIATRLPVAFCFTAVNIGGAYLLWGGEQGLHQLVRSIFSSVTFFGLVPVPLFVLMGEVIFHSGIAFKAIDVVDKWMGRLPGRLGIVTVASATLFSTLSGSSIGTTAMLGSTLTPEMERRGYKKPISLGCVMGSGGLAMIIPPSALAVVLGALAEISIGRLLIAGILPGLLIAALYSAYIIGRCWLQPSIAPSYVPSQMPLSEKLISTVRYVLPFGLVIISVIFLIFMGIATPSESSAMGALTCYILVAIYRRFNWNVVKKATAGTLRIAVMLMVIITGATAFSQILAYTGASRGLTEFVVGLNLPPLMLMIAMQLVIIALGMFMDPVCIMMIVFPIFLPVLEAMGFNVILFGLLVLISLEISGTTPPFGMLLFVMKGIAPPGTTMADICLAALPFIICDLLAMAIIIAFPQIALLLPSLMIH
jgi:tripartite ATP-independent transporter DctM subunit